ncbi:hypothetical protein L2E82_33919 [Cichorium intybus]|uniref:Uncharacterized protein n=1 Tax=Cichorium intybus TaxID=13427 RepID=A0ACB9BLL7_CICIN|nr:hypothetical protein L2E82_33919 [Cichorium intybus]
MFRALKKRKGRRDYEQLISEPTVDDHPLSDPKIIGSTPSPPVKFVLKLRPPVRLNFIEKQMRKVSKVHPLFSLLEKKNRKKKVTAKPEFSRYVQYLKEGGIWDANSAKPVIY